MSPARALLPAWTGARAQLLAGASAQSSGAGWGRWGKADSALAKLVLVAEADSAEVTGSPSLQYLGRF